MSFDRPYLLAEFPGYDYNNPVHPWDMDINKPDGPRNCAWQMQAFHYYWCLRQCKEDAEIGLSLDIPNLPHCFLVSSQPNQGHIGSGAMALESIDMVIQPRSFKLIVASSALQKITCAASARCDNGDARTILKRWITLLRPGGVLIAALMDENFSAKNGRDLKDTGWTHTWSPRTFESRILRPIAEEHLETLEFDTFKNGMSFNVVLQRNE